MPDTQIARMEKVGEFKHLLFGFREVIFVPEKDVFFAAMGDLEVISRFDNFLGSISFPWGHTEKEKKSFADSVGAVEMWHKVQKRGSTTTFGKGWGNGCTSQGICIAFSKKLMMVAIGMDSGEVIVYKLNDFGKNIKQIFKEKAHSKRVMGVAFIDKRKLLYSIGEDGHIRCTNLTQLFVMSEALVSESKLTCMKIHQPSNTAVITDRTGTIFFYNIFSVVVPIDNLGPTHKAHKLRTALQEHHQGPRCRLRGR